MPHRHLIADRKNGSDAGTHEARKGAANTISTAHRRDVYKFLHPKDGGHLAQMPVILRGSLTILCLRLTKALIDACAAERRG